MAVHWSHENIIADHQELQATTMALNWKGDLAVLAGKRNVALINLNKPSEVSKKVSRKQLKYGISSAEWNPTAVSSHYFVVAAGEKVDIFSSGEASLTNEVSLRAHTRNVSDLNWHKSDPHLLATCSIDTFIYLWDTRETRMPTASISGLTGALQVKWSKLDPNILATGHDCNIRIWDRRKLTQPLCYITAHLSKIHSIDWSTHNESYLMSTSDSTVKIFDIKNPKKEEIFINTPNPVWRARYTPFVGGIVTVVVPPFRRGENILYLWSVLDKSGPVHTFQGHSDVIVEFGWCNRETTDNGTNPQMDYQLVTFSRDNTLRIWKIDPHLLKVCGQGLGDDEVFAAEESLEATEADNISVKDEVECATQALDQQIISEGGQNFPIELNSNMRSENSIDTNITCSYSSQAASSFTLNPPVSGVNELNSHSLKNGNSSCFIRDHSSNATHFNSSLPYNHLSQSLQQEFISVNSMRESLRPGVWEINTDEEKRTCQLSVRYGPTMAVLYIMFPLSYPRASPPSFKFLSGTTLDINSRRELLKMLKNISSQSQIRKKGCLEHCIKELSLRIKNLSKGEEFASISDATLSGSSLNIQLYGGQQDFRIPFPRTSGARFCSSGKLICFARPIIIGTSGLESERDTPRSLSALRANIKSYLYPLGQSQPADKDVSVSDFYFPDTNTKNEKTKKENKTKIVAGNVTVYDVSELVPVSRDVATSYVFGEDDLSGVCNKNRDTAVSSGRKELVQTWSIASLIASSAKSSSKCKLSSHPMGRKLVSSLIDHYIGSHDVQTAATLCCIFGDKPHATSSPNSWKHKYEQAGTGRSNYKTIHGINTEGFDLSRVRHCRSNSEGSLAEAPPRPPLEKTHDELNNSQEKEDQSLLDVSRVRQYNEIRRAYADILYGWDLLQNRALVTKYIQTVPQTHVGMDFQVECCGQPCHQPICDSCKKYSFICSICHLPVRGASNFCIVCGHGGHMYHIDDWFTDNDECPTGCGCQCIKEMENFIS